MRWEDGVVYGLILAGIYFLVGVLFFYAGKEKIFDGLGAPAGIEKQFSGTFLATIPGVDAAWTILGILEFAIFVLTVVSLIRFEFMPDRRKPFMLSALALAIFTFLGPGDRPERDRRKLRRRRALPLCRCYRGAARTCPSLAAVRARQLDQRPRG
jgi:hypothetical protein